MTLVVGITSEDSIWLLTDRRISYGDGSRVDDARKLLILETDDGLALLGYAGLGATALGTEPGDWMSRVVRGRNLGLERSLALLTDAVRAKLPRHLERLSAFSLPVHNIMIPAFLNDSPRLYSIDLIRPRGRSQYYYRLNRYLTQRNATPRITIAGRGGSHLGHERAWGRELLGLVKACNAGRIHPRIVAKALARLNHNVSQKDDSVSSRCIVVWRTSKRSKVGGHDAYFNRGEPEQPVPHQIPVMASGMDISAIASIIMPQFLEKASARFRGESDVEMDWEAVKTQVQALPDTPDENLS